MFEKNNLFLILLKLNLTMGNFFYCLENTFSEENITITTSPNRHSYLPTIQQEDHKKYILYQQQCKSFSAIKSKTIKNFAFTKLFIESPIDQLPKTSRTKNSAAPVNNVFFREDFSSINTSNLSTINQIQTQNSPIYSQESRGNKRLIVPILYLNSHTSNKIIINKKEIFVSYDSIDYLCDNDIIYDGILNLINQQNLSVYIQFFKNEMKIYKTENNSNLEEYDNLKYEDILSVSKYQNKNKNDDNNNKFAFDVLMHDKHYQFGTEDEIVGKCCYKVIIFLVKKHHSF